MIQNLVPYNPHHLPTLLTRDRIYNHVPMDPDEVLAVEYRVFILTRGVDDLDGEVLVAVADDFAEGVFDGGVVGVDEVAVDVLHGEGGFAWEESVSEVRCGVVLRAWDAACVAAGDVSRGWEIWEALGCLGVGWMHRSLLTDRPAACIPC